MVIYFFCEIIQNIEWYEGVIHDVARENENIHNLKIEFNPRDI